MDTEALLATLNTAPGVSYTLLGRTESGLQSGAGLVRDPAGRPAILKPGLPRVEAAAAAVAGLRAPATAGRRMIRGRRQPVPAKFTRSGTM
jgi:hypothetical protein